MNSSSVGATPPTRPVPHPSWRDARTVLLAALLSVAAAVPGHAQRAAPEFVRQGLLVPGFLVDPGVDARTAARAGDEARAVARSRSNGREVEVIGTTAIRTILAEAGFRASDAWIEADIHSLGIRTRADEYLVGRVEQDGRAGRPVRLSGALVLMRNTRLRQPLPAATAATVDDAAAILGESLVAARGQLAHVRRCENGLRSGDPSAAIRAARSAIVAYPRATIARTCLVWALREDRRPAAELLSVAQEILALDSANYYGLEAAALALDSLGRHPEAAPYWTRLARTDSANRELAERVLYALHAGRSLEEGERLAVRLAGEFPEHIQFSRHQWRISFERQSWATAIAAGEVLLARDSLALADPAFFRRLATAYRAAGLPFKAVETVARGVSLFPGDARLYSLYTQFVMAESDTVLPRGLALFPRDGDLLALRAQHLRAGGRLADAVTAMREAIAAGSTVPDAALMLAQAEMELGRTDSALVSLRDALAAGTDSTRLAQFAFARGNTLYRAAQATKSSADHALALRFLALADSVRPSAQSRLLLGMTALGLAQAALAEAFASTDAAKRCMLARQASSVLPVARASLEFGRDVSAEAVEQGVAYIGQLEPYTATAIQASCPGPEDGARR
jgi:tetratricopeptide (TPR) repeat protein